MDRKTIKSLQTIALFLQIFTVLITVLMTIFQKTVEELFRLSSRNFDIHSIPLDLFLQVIPLTILYGITLFIVTKAKPTHTKSGTVACVVVAVLIQIIAPFITDLCTRLYAFSQGLEEFADYMALTTTIERVITPIQLIAFTVFCLSLGGYYKSENCEKEN